MSYSIGWYIENEVLYIHYPTIMTGDEMRKILFDSKAFIDSSPRVLVHTYHDLGDVMQPVPPREALEILREVGDHERAGWSIMLREKSVLLRMGVAFGTSVFKMRNKAFNSMDDADAFLKTVDDLNWDKVNSSIPRF